MPERYEGLEVGDTAWRHHIGIQIEEARYLVEMLFAHHCMPLITVIGLNNASEPPLARLHLHAIATSRA